MFLFRKNILFIFVVFFTIVFTIQANAQTVKIIKISGNLRTSSDYIKSLLTLKPGSSYTPYALTTSVEELYNTDLFSKITPKYNNISRVLSINVKENPIVSEVVFNGNSHISNDIIHKEITLASNFSFSERKLNSDINRIISLYAKGGYLSTKVTPKIEKESYNKVKIIINIFEGKKSVISNIKFIGNKSFSSYRLGDVVLTRPYHWWRFLSPNYTYDENRISYDGELLKQFYINEGYINFHILSSYVVVNSNNEYQLIFNLSEGNRYQFDKFKLDIKIPNMTDRLQEFASILKVKKTTWYSQKKIQSVISLLRNKLSDMGYNFVKITPKITPNAYFKSVDVMFKIEPTAQNLIERINISGNTKTYNQVIRRVLGIREGDPYSAASINKAKINIYNMGYFGSNVNLTTSQGSYPDRTIVNINVKEDRTGYISLSGVYNTLDGFGVQLQYTEPNLAGSGNTLNAYVNLTFKSLNFNTSISDPHFMDRNIFTSVGLFNTVNDYTDISGYSISKLGGNTALGYKLTTHLQQKFTYTLSLDNIYDVDKSSNLSGDKGITMASIISHTLTYDKRNNLIYPTSGYTSSFSTDYSGIGGDVYYLRNTLSGTVYQAVYQNIVLVVDSSVGYIKQVRSNVKLRISDLFFLGGESLRGFASAGIGPKDSYDNSLGGKYMFKIREQIDFPVPLVANFGLLLHIFNDNGNIDNVYDNMLEYSHLRSSIGLGISWRSPFGLLSLDWGWAVKSLASDKKELFLLNFGTRF